MSAPWDGTPRPDWVATCSGCSRYWPQDAYRPGPEDHNLCPRCALWLAGYDRRMWQRNVVPMSLAYIRHIWRSRASMARHRDLLDCVTDSGNGSYAHTIRLRH